MTKLNKEQALAVHHVDGPMLVLAGPGSGKTTVLAERVRILIEEQKISPENILVLTFSKKAAREMQQRFNKLINGNSYPVSFGTFHAVFFHILQQYYRSQNEYPNSSQIKEDQVTLEAPDFDAMISDCRKLLLENSAQRRKWQARYRYILVDEFQDSNEMQYDVLKLLAGERSNLFCVGDEDQSIYGFRGAVPQIMQQFQKEYPACRIMELTANYRCGKEIIQIADSLIRHNTSRIKVQRQWTPVAYESINAVTARRFLTKEEEAAFVAEELKRLTTAEDNTPIRKITVLYRVQSSAGLLEEKLLQNGIPYERKDAAQSFYAEEWVKDVLSYLKLAVGCTERGCIYRILNRPPRALSRECVPEKGVDFDMMYSYYREMPEQTEKLKTINRDLNRLSEMSPFAAVNYILKGVGYEKHLRQKLIRQGYDRADITDRLDELLERSRNFADIKEWLSYIDELEAVVKMARFKPYEANTENVQNNRSSDRQAQIVLQTIHASKGLEYDAVFVMGLTEGVLPHKRADTLEKIEEERRLLYVAVTRAEKQLYLCAVENSRTGKSISRFAKEMCCQFD